MAEDIQAAAVTVPEGAEPRVPCPCSTRTLEDLAGHVVWRATDGGMWCGNPARPWVTRSGQQRQDGWCEDCITKVCPWCRND